MTELCRLIFTRQSGIWPILCQLMAILAKCFEIWTSHLFFPLFTLILIYEPILKSIMQTQIRHIIPKKSLKWPYLNSPIPILPKCHSLKGLLLLHFSMNLSGMFNVNMDFANNNCSRFFDLGPQKLLSPKSEKSLFQRDRPEPPPPPQ